MVCCQLDMWVTMSTEHIAQNNIHRFLNKTGNYTQCKHWLLSLLGLGGTHTDTEGLWVYGEGRGCHLSPGVGIILLVTDCT